ncbi:MAG: 1-acyl-sn-glycerol-3-phosphate acyltransferase [Chloroflexi bacterium]|nr:1-acyl-sn-glycerol-3-phosphate acyltransferase [Chloroflexota bacterium]
MKRETLLNIIRSLLDRLATVEFYGLEHIPPKGGVIIATNHLSRLDIPFLFINPVRSDITALVADKYRAYLFFHFIIKTAGGIYIDRSKADFTAFRAALDALRQGRALGISPEGTRSISGQLLEGKSGTVLLAEKGNVPIIPVGLTGTEGGFTKILTLQHPHLVARFGPMFRLPPVSREHRDEDLKRNTDEVMLRIAALLPERYRGFYANHPRLGQYLASI